jgi:uncharacterized membrane protein
MESQTKLFGHAVHQQLIPLPIGLFAGAVAFDLLHRVTGDGKWGMVASATTGAGIIGGLVAAPFGTSDWLAIPEGTRAKQIGAIHGLGNVAVLGLFAASWWLRRDNPYEARPLPFALSLAGIGLVAGTGWLGGELVSRLGVGIDRGAHLNSPSSLTEQPAHAAEDGIRVYVMEGGAIEREHVDQATG